jgi:two-component system LytT family response regulator
MQKIRALIVDDEKPARQRLVDLLAKQAEVTVAGECGSGVEAVQVIRESKPDLLFLDIQMPGFSGFEVINQVGLAHLPVTVFVTAYDAYAVRAFEANAIDYLLKPYSDERFDRCLSKAISYVTTQRREELSSRLASLLEGPPCYLERLLIKAAGRVIFLITEDVDWIGADGVYVQLHAGSRKYLHRASMNEMESQLDPNRFVRVHRSTIVNTASVKELYPHSHGDYVIVLRDGTELRLSRSYKARFEMCFGGAL